MNRQLPAEITAPSVPAVVEGVVPGTAHHAFPLYKTLPPGCVPWPIRV